MNVNNPPLPPGGAADIYKSQDVKAQGTQRSSAALNGSSSSTQASSTQSSGDDVHLSELVRSLRALAADSPERQARIEQITRAYASGNYHIDVRATADGIIRDAARS